MAELYSCSISNRTHLSDVYCGSAALGNGVQGRESASFSAAVSSEHSRDCVACELHALPPQALLHCVLLMTLLAAEDGFGQTERLAVLLELHLLQQKWLLVQQGRGQTQVVEQKELLLQVCRCYPDCGQGTQRLWPVHHSRWAWHLLCLGQLQHCLSWKGLR